MVSWEKMQEKNPYEVFTNVVKFLIYVEGCNFFQCVHPLSKGILTLIFFHQNKVWV
jgi:hypothetical protein